MPDVRVVELRIHGVSGGQAEELLDVEPAMRVGGDRLSGFFRRRRASDTEVVPGVPREIFAWGNLTSGRASRALWLLLLPFMLVNIAYWMRPGEPGAPPPAARAPLVADSVYGSAVRLLALCLTVLLTLAAAGIGMDLVGWQCAGHYGERCAELRPLLGVVSAPGGLLAEPGRAVLAGAVLPLAVVALLWRLSRRTSSVYEAEAGGAAPAPSGSATLSSPEFWQNSLVMGRLRSAHIAVAVGTVALLLVTAALGHDRGTGGALHAAGAAVAAGAALAVAAAALMVLVPGTARRWNDRADAVCARLRDASLVLLAAAAAYLLWPRPGWEAQGRLPGLAPALNSLLALECALLLVLFGAAAVLYRRTPGGGGAAMRGLAGPAASAVGLLLGGVFTAAVVYQSAGLLGGCYYPGAERAGCLPLHVPGAYHWLQLAFAMETVIAVAVAAVLAARLRRRRSAEAEAVAALYGRPREARRTREIAAARALGGMTEALPACLAAFLLPGGALMVLAAVALGTGRLTAGPPGGPAAFAGGATEWVQGAVSFGVTVGSWLGGLLLAALVLVGQSAYRNRPMRQAVGVLWDIGTFWPRAAHPLAPPSYAERAVPQLVARVVREADEGRAVLLSGHSQGSVLAAATVWLLPPRCRPRVALITHGSPLHRLYARYFPAHFGPAALADVERRVVHWRNLWRCTDAIGGPVHTAPGGGGTVGFADPLPDPRSYDVPPGEALYPEVLGHSFYVLDPAYAAAAERAVRLLLPGTVGAVAAADAAHGGAHVEDEDERRDQGEEGEHPASAQRGQE